ncbi:hypothetical protein PUN28_014363 [Cardiocondyla obscurior]|uniref:PH domain-containing protein n=1 Tax=Cardiocondyla obscurior TaxID=286306 RepID=A0AAW2F111_9HYME
MVMEEPERSDWLNWLNAAIQMHQHVGSNGREERGRCGGGERAHHSDFAGLTCSSLDWPVTRERVAGAATSVHSPTRLCWPRSRLRSLFYSVKRQEPITAHYDTDEGQQYRNLCLEIQEW